MKRTPVASVISLFVSLNNLVTSRVKEHGQQYNLFAIFGLINYILPFFMWSEDMIITTFPIYLRSFASLFCFLLLLKDHWPTKLRQYLPLYWYFTLLYSLPFLTSYLLFFNQGSTDWLMNMVLAIFLLVLLVDWLSFIIILSLGSFLALLVFKAVHGSISLLVDMENLYLAFYMYFFTILIGLVFSRNKAKIDFERFSAMEGLSASIAHEIRTPLSSLRMNAELVRLYLPKLLDFYEEKKSQDPSTVDLIKPQHKTKLQQVTTDIDSTIQKAFLIVDMLLTNIKAFKDNPVTLQPLNMKACINEAIQAFPFREEQKDIIHIDSSVDFNFEGDVLMVRHIFYNLIKNALHHINDVDDPKIELWGESLDDEYLLNFKDNGMGIKESDLPYVFDRFYSRRKHGTGVGLSFCKMAMKKFDGNIACVSDYGNYAQFILSFPKVSKS